MNSDEQKGMEPTQQQAEGAAKKPYETPELTVHGKVNEITKVLLAISHH